MGVLSQCEMMFQSSGSLSDVVDDGVTSLLGGTMVQDRSTPVKTEVSQSEKKVTGKGNKWK